MALVTFFEKPGCATNARQKKLLIQSGHELDVRDMLLQPWIAPHLRSFFGSRPVTEWFNRAAPKIRDGIINPETLAEDEALELMCADPLLIRRPLLEADGRRECGFDEDLIDRWIGLARDREKVGDSCSRDAAA